MADDYLDWSKGTLNLLLKEFPRFYYKEDDGNFHKIQKIISETIILLNNSKKLVELSNNIKRPLHLWKTQNKDNDYTINYQVRLDNILNVKLFKEDLVNGDELLFDSGILALDTNWISGEFHEFSENEIIPSTKYYLIVEDYEEHKFTKGYPENDTPLKDKYDHDPVLDVFAGNLGLVRRVHIPVAEYNYPKTYPAYCNSGTEEDYWLELRLLEFIKGLGTGKLPELELKQYFNIIPLIEGRWRYLCRMDDSLMDSKYMSTEDWDNPCYTVNANLDDVPKNFNIPSDTAILNIINFAFPLSKKIYFEFSQTDNIPLNNIGLIDNVQYSLAPQDEKNCLIEEYTGDTTYPEEAPSVLFEQIKGEIDYSVNKEILATNLKFLEYAKKFFVTSIADFNANGTHNNTNAFTWGGDGQDYLTVSSTIFNTGDVAIDPGDSGYYCNSSLMGNEGYNDWANLNLINRYQAGGTTCTTTASSGTGRYGEYIKAYNFGFSNIIPVDAIIVGVKAFIWVMASRASSINDNEVYLLNTSLNATGNNKASSSYYPTSSGLRTWGGSSDLWGCALTASWVRNNNFGVFYRQKSDYNGSVQTAISWLGMTVYYRDLEGNWLSATIVKDTNQICWDRLENSSWYAPTNQVSRIEIQNASTGTILKTINPVAEQNPNFVTDLSDIDNVDIKINWYGKSTNINEIPSIGDFTVYNKKEYKPNMMLG